MRLKIGQVIYPSEAGHYGFLYPKRESPLQLTSAVDVEPLYLLGDSDYVAYKPVSTLKARGEDNEYHEIKDTIWVKKTTNKYSFDSHRRVK